MGFDPGWSTRRLVARRDEAARMLPLLGEFTPGSVSEAWSKCGKPTCHCAAEGDPGHGPRLLWVRYEAGKTRTMTVPARMAGDFRSGVASYQRFMDVVREVADINAVLAERAMGGARPAPLSLPGPSGQKGG